MHRDSVRVESAAGAMTVAAACMALREQVVPPLCNLRVPDTRCPFRFAMGQAERAVVGRALVCGIARGGAGAAIVLRRPATPGSSS